MKLKPHRNLGLLVATATLGLSFVFAACDDSSSAVKEPSPDAGTTRVDSGTSPTSDGGIDFDAGTAPDGAPKDCFDNPTTHFEIINACTTATKITKNPTLTKLLSDGGLPPLN